MTAAGVVALASNSRADASAPSRGSPRSRLCCAFATDLRIHVGAAHTPLSLGLLVSPGALGEHSYSGDGALYENNGLTYTCRGGFVDLGHVRDHADWTAWLAVRLRPLLAQGGGTLDLPGSGGARRVHVLGPVPADALERTSVLLAQRIVFQVSVWAEVLQFYGFSKVPGTDEVHSAFTPEDLYSNLLGTYLGASALESDRPYDEAMTRELAGTLASLEALPESKTRAVMHALEGAWWDPGVPWPGHHIALRHGFDLGPRLQPMLAPTALCPSPPVAVTLDVPQTDERGVPLASLYRLELESPLDAMPPAARARLSPVVTGDDLPRIVADVERAMASRPPYEVAADETAALANEGGTAIGHVLSGLQLLPLQAMGGVASSATSRRGVGGGSLVVLRGDTRGGDLRLMPLDVLYTPERGVIGGVALMRADALFFCHDVETRAVHAPLFSWMRACAPGEWLGVGGSLGELLHDGGTGRTLLRPIDAAVVVDALGNGESPSYEAVRLLARLDASFENVWTAQEGGIVVPRTGASLTALVRTAGRHLELRAAAGYRLDPAAYRDAAFESDLGAQYALLLGGGGATDAVERGEPWGLAAIGIRGGYAYWTRPAEAFPTLAAPFVSATQSGTWQLLATATLAFERFAF